MTPAGQSCGDRLWDLVPPSLQSLEFTGDLEEQQSVSEVLTRLLKLRFCFISVVMANAPSKSNVGDKGFVLTWAYMLQFVIEGKSRQELMCLATPHP